MEKVSEVNKYKMDRVSNVAQSNHASQESQVSQLDKVKTMEAAEGVEAAEAAEDALIIGGETFLSRLFVGTGKYGDLTLMRAAIQAAGTEMVTVALRRLEPGTGPAGEALRRTSLLDYIPRTRNSQNGHFSGQKVRILPNTSGARNAAEAVLAAELARELLHTDLIKLEIHPDPSHLMPDPIETLEAASILVQKGFIVLPYVHADPVLCKRLEEVGVAAVMPLGSPIGSNMGLESRYFLEMIIQSSTVPVIIDAGIGSPSDAALAMEIGADAVLISTALATAGDPVQMARSFKMAVEAGRLAHGSRPGGRGQIGESTSPLTGFLA